MSIQVRLTLVILTIGIQNMLKAHNNKDVVHTPSLKGPRFQTAFSRKNKFSCWMQLMANILSPDIN